MREHKYPIRKIVEAVSEVTDVPVAEMLAEARSHHLLALRWVVSRIARDDGYSLNEIGRAIGGRDHTTVLSGILTAGQHIKAATPRGRLMADVERQAVDKLNGGAWSRLIVVPPDDKPVEAPPPARHEKPAIPEKIDTRAAIRLARSLSMSERPRRVTEAGFVNASGEIVLWGD